MSLPQNIPFLFWTYSVILTIFWSSSGSPRSRVSLWGVTKGKKCIQWMLLTKAIPQKDRLIKTLQCSHVLHSADLVRCKFWPFPQIKMTIQGKGFAWEHWGSQNSTTGDRHGRDFQAALESGKNWGTKCVQSERRGILRIIKGNVSFTEIQLKEIKHAWYSLYTHLI